MPLHGIPGYSTGTFSGLFGDGISGAMGLSSGVQTLSANRYHTAVDLSGSAILFLDGHLVCATQYIKLRGTASINASAVNQAGGLSAGGAGYGSVNQPVGNGASGGAGGSSAGGIGASKLSTSLGGSGGAGGTGTVSTGVGGAGGVASLAASLESRNLPTLMSGGLIGYNPTTSTWGIFPMQGGGGGGGGGFVSGTGNSGLGGGGGGGVIILIAPVIDIGTGCSIKATGANGSSGDGTPGDFGGGGGGGGGGVIILICSKLIENGVIAVSGGLGGSADAVQNGANGSPGTIIRYLLT